MPIHILLPLILLILSLVLLCPLVGWIICRINRLRKELDYINMEIRRTESKERQHWLRRKHHLMKKFFLFQRI